jgi:serine/threonine protein kinase
MDFEGGAKDTIISQTTAAAVAAAREEISYLGHRVKDRYVIEKQLDSGGFGAVYLAHDEQLVGKPVVIKFLLEKALRNDWAVKKFKHEVEALARIDHPGVVGILDTGQLPDGTPFLVMQYIKGVSMRTLMKQEGLEFERASTFIRQLGQGLNAAHEIGVVHRDLKPENIMLRRVAGGEQVKIIDFGIAKVRDSQVAPSTVFAEVAGTVAYMAPEQLTGRPVSPATDQFSLAVIAFEMLTGRRPFNPETQFQLEGMQRDGVQIKPRDLRPGLPEAAQTVLLKALSYHPAERYPTARTFADALADALVESGLVAQNADSAADTILRTAVTEVPARTRSRYIFLLIPAGLLLMAIIAGIAWLSRQNVRHAPSTPKPAVTEPVAVRKLDYSLSVQKMRNGKPFEQPYQTTGAAILENGYDVRLNITSPQPGYLYLVNEGPAGNGLVTYNMLFPMPSMNDGSAQLEANQQQSSAWFELDKNQGTEKLWLIWSETAVPELEAVKGVANPTDMGTVTKPDQVNAIRSFLQQHAMDRPDVQSDPEANINHLAIKGSVLVNLIRLEHH